MKWFIIIILIIIIIVVDSFFFTNTNNRELFESSSQEKDNITIVSGYWRVGNKHGHSKYDDWFKTSLRVNQRYIFFCDESDIPYIQQFRQGLETIFKPYPLDNFYAKKYVKDTWTDPFHIPSKEVSAIWNEKMHLMKLAKDGDDTPTEFYIWIDAGICIYRDQMPPEVRLNLKDIHSLPKDKLCYSGMDDTYHNFTAGVLIIHKDAIDIIHDKYYELLKTCDTDNEEVWQCGSEQANFTKLMKKYPDLFYQLSYGWGESLIALYRDHV
jgi:hypothetical protein